MRKIFRNVYSNLLCAPAEDVNVGQYGGGNVQGVTSSGAEIDDPNAGTPLERAVKTVPEDKGGVAQHGQDANASALDKLGLLNNKMTRKILEFNVHKHPFFTAVFAKANQIPWVGHKEADIPEVGEIRLEARLKQAYAYDSSTPATTLDLGTSYLNYNDASIFRKNHTIFVLGVKGWREGSVYTDGVSHTTGTGNEAVTTYTGNSNDLLALMVTDVSNSGVPTVKALNGPAKSAGSSECVIPSIPAGAILRLGLPILAEEEVETDPLNIEPTWKKVYLQKKGYSVAFTDFFNEAVKDVDVTKDFIKRQTLDTYKRIYTTQTLFGPGRKFNKKTKNGIRVAYAQKGIINDIRMIYELPNGKWTKEVLISIAKMLFTTYSNTDEIEVFCGSDAIESILNIDWGNSVHQMVSMKDDVYNINVNKFICTFGTLIFTHEIALTENHLEKAAIAIPMRDCSRIYRDKGKTLKVDGKKGETGTVEELVKEYFIEDDCFNCTALNSMIIGPAELFSGNDNVVLGAVEQFKAVESLPNASADNLGNIYYLTVSTANNGLGLWQVVSTGNNTYGYKAYTRDNTRA